MIILILCYSLVIYLKVLRKIFFGENKFKKLIEI